MIDPITTVYNALWGILEADAEFTALVKAGNRIKFSGDNQNPLKDQAITSDYPEVRIVSQGSVPHVLRTSNSSSLIKTFAIQILSGDQRLDAIQFPLEWIIYRALASSIGTLLALTWNSKSFVKNAKPTSVNDSFGNREPQSTIRAWIAVWACEVEMWFQTSDL